jgi:ubiquitin-protein ligase E3 A
MFVYRKTTGNYWFESTSADLQEFRLIGLLLGLAIYNDVILDIHFPHVVYKFLMGIKPTFSDLQDIDRV